jgi:lantibiotic modifying enzyme
MGAAAGKQHQWRLEYRALGPTAYAGTSGVGLFLAQLAAVTGDVAARRTAIGALRHALDHALERQAADRDGLHAGVVGIALAATRAAALLDEEEPRARARGLLSEVGAGSSLGSCPDVVMGIAGTAIGLLALGEAFGDQELVERAAETGEQLIDRATVTRHGWSWGSPGPRYPHHLCGLSHGAAGIGWALLELFAATGDERFRRGARGAFDYERSWLDTATGTWPDLRLRGQRRGRVSAGGSPATGTWCHGEAGIALTRLRAVALLGSDPDRRDADIALEATRRHVAGLLPHEVEDLSLCHGAAGAADVLLCGGRRSHEAVELGHAMLERYGASGARWPCGVPQGTTPGLFLGLSGIAWWFLRLHDDRVRSPLGTWVDPLPGET